jgi:hypothetical protein
MLLVRLAFALVALLSAVTPAPPWSGLPMRTIYRGGIPGDPVNVAFDGARDRPHHQREEWGR